jgi:phosphatidylglycerophosphatase A
MKWTADPRILRDPVHFLAFGFGAGLLPYAPGTAGTLIAVPLLLLSAMWGHTVQSVITVAITLIGIYICEQSSRKLGVHDHSGIVWDEIAGFFIACWAIPLQWQWLAAAFAVFRFFDIVKPSPIREADHSLRGGVGIMLDDVLAGVFTGVILYVIQVSMHSST